MSDQEEYEKNAIAVVVEHASTDGHCGVLVTRDKDGRFLHAMATTEVPYGVIRQYTQPE